MKVRFKTQVNKGKGTAPAGAVYELPDAKAKAYIARGLAEACDDKSAMTDGEKAKAERAEKKAAEEAAKRAAEQAGGVS